MSTDYVEYTEGSGAKIAAVSKTEGSDSLLMERVSVDHDQLNFGTTKLFDAYSTPDGECTGLDCTGKSLIVFKVSYSANTNIATFRVRFDDYEGTAKIIYTNEFRVPNTAIADGALYHGEPVIIKNPGAKTAYLRLESISAGTVTVYGSAV